MAVRQHNCCTGPRLTGLLQRLLSECVSGKESGFDAIEKFMGGGNPVFSRSTRQEERRRRNSFRRRAVGGTDSESGGGGKPLGTQPGGGEEGAIDVINRVVWGRAPNYAQIASMK